MMPQSSVVAKEIHQLSCLCIEESFLVNVYQSLYEANFTKNNKTFFKQHIKTISGWAWSSYQALPEAI
jgi:hypothetical protein